jgi:hypothetical protein
MGRANRERRAAKKRRDESRRGEHRSREGAEQHRQPGPDGGGGRPDLRYLMVASATMLARGATRESLSEDVEELIRDAAGAIGPVRSALFVDEVLSDCMDGLWEAGWQPGETARAVRRLRSPSHADLAVTAVAAWYGRRVDQEGIVAPPEWARQIDEIGAAERWWGVGRDWLGPWALRASLPWPDALILAIETLSAMMRLPVTETLIPTPSQWKELARLGRSEISVDAAVLAKVRALLAKAESTNFEHEADALTAKAQELIARHSIEEAMARSSSAQRITPVGRRLAVDDPYAAAKSGLLAVVASANSVRAVWDETFALMTLVGFPSDLEVVEMLFTSLLMQASRSVLEAGKVSDPRGRSRTRSFRQSFYVAFSGRIHERLEMASRQATVDAERELGSEVLPVLASRREEVDDATERMFPNLRRARGMSVTNEAGWRAGRVAAELASLGKEQPRLADMAG